MSSLAAFYLAGVLVFGGAILFNASTSERARELADPGVFAVFVGLLIFVALLWPIIALSGALYWSAVFVAALAGRRAP